MSITIRLDHVEKRFGSLRAVDDVTLDLSPSIVGLLGPNGAGKTTLMRMVATVLAPDRGRVEILGQSTATAGEREAIRRDLGYLPQEPGFHRGFRAFEFVDYVAILKGMVDRDSRHDEVRRVLGLMDLEEVMHKRIRSLSGGMRRRLAIAQSLLGDPSLLVLDEPTAGLDPELRLRFREVLTDRAAERTVLLSTHQTDDVAALCQRVMVLHQGRVRFDGTTAELAAVAESQVWVAGARDPRARLAWVGGDGRTRHIGNPPNGAETVEPTIEDGYLLLVGKPSVEAAA